MALMEIFHVVASNLIIDANDATDIPQGAIVTLDDNYNVTLANSDDAIGAANRAPVGIAGDTRSTGVTSHTPESGSAQSRNPKTSMEGSLVTGAWGASQRFTQNRVADNYNEVLASGKMTVYHGGGEFWTDQYQIVQSNGTTICNYRPASALYVSGATETAHTAEPEGTVAGQFTDELTAGYITGLTLTAPTSYPSGVPGTETAFQSLPEGGNSLTWGTLLHVKLIL